jgi:hypothetical protein
MPTMYVTIYDNDCNPLLAPLPYKKIGGKYFYGPEANGGNGKKSRKPVALKIPWWRKAADGYRDLFYAITHWK